MAKALKPSQIIKDDHCLKSIRNRVLTADIVFEIHIIKSAYFFLFFFLYLMFKMSPPVRWKRLFPHLNHIYSSCCFFCDLFVRAFQPWATKETWTSTFAVAVAAADADWPRQTKAKSKQSNRQTNAKQTLRAKQTNTSCKQQRHRGRVSFK